MSSNTQDTKSERFCGINGGLQPRRSHRANPPQNNSESQLPTPQNERVRYATEYYKNHVPTSCWIKSMPWRHACNGSPPTTTDEDHTDQCSALPNHNKSNYSTSHAYSDHHPNGNPTSLQREGRYELRYHACPRLRLRQQCANESRTRQMVTN